MNLIKGCLNWKVIGGLLVLGGVLVVMAPGIGAAAIPVLFMLACPLSMLVMMPLMMKGINADNQPASPHRAEPLQLPDQHPLSHIEQISRLKAQMTFLQSQQEELGQQIDQLETPVGSVRGEAERVVVQSITPGERAGNVNWKLK